MTIILLQGLAKFILFCFGIGMVGYVVLAVVTWMTDLLSEFKRIRELLEQHAIPKQISETQSD